MTDDVAKVADKLNENQIRTMTWWSKGNGVIQCDVPKSTQNALVKRGLAEWTPGDDLCAHLTPFGLEVQEYLFAKAEAEQRAKDEARAARFAAEQKIREEGYAAGQRQVQLLYLSQLNEAVYGCGTWPDRPWDSVWEHLLEQVRSRFPREVA